MTPVRDESFYMSFIVFKVENMLFKVPRRPFEEHSDVFRAMFTLPPGSQTETDGLSDERPLILQGIKCDDFRPFLKALYPPCIGEVIQLSEPEWASVLSLAHMWAFHRIRKLAIDELANCNVDEIRKVELAHRFEIEEWYHDAYTALVRREHPLSYEEAHRLGFDFAFKMGRVREDILKGMVLNPGSLAGPGWHRSAHGRRAKGGGGGWGREFDLPGFSAASSSAGVPEIAVLQNADESSVDRALLEVFNVKRIGPRRNDTNNQRRAFQLANQFPIDYVLTVPDLDGGELL
ncbi:hypothetical protein SCHPADRAFT_827519 [Schizopora paradoxa]|uniref:BTB domain-containing protein n=1 Tax=Schizopora paradoxa TaxID=27342 RepID=A0A0H2RQ93_9AGAM|nr:hypothetical protein SCHPADRAFT_827519 [Schizopora paradoxa]